MSYQKSTQIYPWQKEGWVFSWGLVDNTPQVNMGEQYSPYLRNCRLDGNSIIIRPWREVLATLDAWDYPRGIWSYLDAVDPADNLLLVRHETTDPTEKIVTIDVTDGDTNPVDTWVLVSSLNRMRFMQVWGAVYCMNGSDDFGKYDVASDTYSAPSTWISNFAPAFSVLFNGCHWASWRSTNPSIVYKSVADNYEDFNSSWSDQFTFGENITGLSSNNSALFYFTKNTVSVTGQNDIQQTSWTITYFTRKLQTTEGAVNHWSIVEAWTAIYYLTPSNAINKIVAGWDVYGFEVLDLSERMYKGITTTMSRLDPNQTDSFWQFYPAEMLIKWHVKSIGATFNDLVIVYDITKDKFLVDENVFYYDGVYMNGYNYTTSMIEPKVYKDEINQDDEDSPIPFEYRTKEFYISDPTYKKILRESRTLLDINRLASLKQDIYIDWEQQDTKTVDSDNIPISTGGIGTAAVGTFAIGTEGLTWLEDDYNEIYILRTKGNLNKKGYKVQFRYSCWTLAAKVRLKSLSMKVEVLPWEANDLTV